MESEHGVPTMGENGVPMMGEHGVPIMGEHGVPIMGEHGEILVSTEFLGWVSTEYQTASSIQHDGQRAGSAAYIGNQNSSKDSNRTGSVYTGDERGWS